MWPTHSPLPRNITSPFYNPSGELFPICCYFRTGNAVVQRKTAVAAYFSSKQLLLFAFAILLRQTKITAHYSNKQLLPSALAFRNGCRDSGRIRGGEVITRAKSHRDLSTPSTMHYTSDGIVLVLSLQRWSNLIPAQVERLCWLGAFIGGIHGIHL